MAENNITSLVVNISLIGLVLLGMLTSFILIVNNEDRGQIFEGTDIEEFNLNLTQAYSQDLVETTNVNINLSASYNPELAISAADQSGNAIGLNQQDFMMIVFASFSVFGSIIFGSVWGLIFLILGSFLGMYFTYYFVKWIRSGS